MVRNYKKKTNRSFTTISPEDLLAAVREVDQNGSSIRSTAKKYGMNYKTLGRYCKKIPEKEILDLSIKVPSVEIGHMSRKIFSKAEEQELAQYLIKASEMYMNLTPKRIRSIAYQVAIKNNIKHPTTWDTNLMAGEDWLTFFMLRHPELKKPEAASLAQASSFNKTNVKLFFNNFIEIQQRYKFTAKDLYNMDETGITTLQTPNHIIARRGEQQVSSTEEKGTLVTVASTICALGTFIPPFFVFPRSNFKDYFLNNAPQGSSGSANESGLMTESDFIKYLEHFVKFAKPTKNKPCLLILDNHRSHLILEGLDFAKEHGIVMLTLPPHCSHKMQPLDRTILEPFKKFINTACKNWKTNHPGHLMSIHDIPEIITFAYPLAFTKLNIETGFRCTGIFPLNCNIFTDSDFAH